MFFLLRLCQRPLISKVCALDFALRLSISPKDNAFFGVCAQPFADSFKRALNVNFCDAVLYKIIFVGMIRVPFEVWTNGFICPILQYNGVFKCYFEPLIFRLVSYFYPMRPMSSNWVWVTTRDCTFRRLFTFLGILTLIEHAVEVCATRTVNFKCCITLTF